MLYSCGSDGIFFIVIQLLLLFFMYPIFVLFRCYIDENIFPDVWKICSVISVHKFGDFFNVFNYIQFDPTSLMKTF